MLSSWAVAKDDGAGSKEMHMVYASPGTIAAYRKDGRFPDGTVAPGMRCRTAFRRRNISTKETND